MNGVILLISIICFSVGFSSFSLSFFLFSKYKNRALLLYSVSMGLWSFNIFVIRILDILQLQFWNIQESNSITTSLLSNISWGAFSFFILYTIYVISDKKMSRKAVILLLLSSTFLMVPFDVVPVFGFSSFLIYIQIAFHLIILYRSTFILKSIVSTFTKKRVRVMYSRLVNFLLFFFPVLIIDLLPITLTRFQFGLGIYPLFYLLVNLFFLRFVSNFIYFPKLDRSRPGVKSKNNIYSLTKREFQIAKLIVDGKSYKDISEELVIAQETVKTHISNIYKKTNVSNKIGLVSALSNPHKS